MRRWMVQAAAVVLAAAGLGSLDGCGETTAPNVTIPDAAAHAAGASIAAQVGEIAASFSTSSFLEQPFLVAERGSKLRLPRLDVARLAADHCAVVGDTTDTDADGVPDDLTVVFPADSCTVAGDSATVTLSGSVRITDPGTAAGFGITYSNLQLHIASKNGDSLTFGFDGTRDVNATPASAGLSENVTLTIAARASTVTHTVSLAQNWSVGFTPAAGQSIDLEAALPDGALALTGSTTFVADAQSFAFAVRTQVPLEHAATCATPPTFTAGELRAVVSGNQGGAFVRIQFVGCGVDPIVTLVAQPAQ